MIYVKSGKIKITSGRKYIELSENSLFFISDLSENINIFFDENTDEFYVFGINGFLGRNIFKENEMFKIIDARKIKNQLNNICDALNFDLDISELFAYSENIMSIITSSYFNHIYCHSVNFKFHKMPIECNKLRQYIEDNYNCNINLDVLAEIAHMNKYYVSHMFTKFFYISPISYLIKFRISKSKELLLSENLSISDVSSMSGFASHSYFSQAFKKICGISPTNFREIYKKTC